MHKREKCPVDQAMAVVDARAREVIEEGEALWERFYYELRGEKWHGFVAADYKVVYRALAKLRGRAVTFLEWGSGSGLVTILADLLGFEAYGIEIDERLVEMAAAFATRVGSGAQFSRGSFIPEAYEWTPEFGEAGFRTQTHGADGYDDLDMELRDFDIVYAYPWPDEEPMFHDIMRTCGRKTSIFITYGAFEGLEVHRRR